jgi:hypothetical protein
VKLFSRQQKQTEERPVQFWASRSARELTEELGSALRLDADDNLWVEINIRLGVEGANGIRLGGPTADEPRLRAYIAGRELAERTWAEEGPKLASPPYPPYVRPETDDEYEDRLLKERTA